MTKTETIKNYLLEHGEITSMEAIKKFGDTRLSATIYNLRRKENMNIKTINKVVKTRFNRPAVIAVYTLFEGQDHETC